MWNFYFLHFCLSILILLQTTSLLNNFYRSYWSMRSQRCSVMTSLMKLLAKENEETILCALSEGKAEMPAYALLNIMNRHWKAPSSHRFVEHRASGSKPGLLSEKHLGWKTEKKSLVVQRGCRVGAKHFQQSVFISLEGARLIRLHLLLDVTVVKIRGFFKKSMQTLKNGILQLKETFLLKIGVCLLLVLPIT